MVPRWDWGALSWEQPALPAFPFLWRLVIGNYPCSLNLISFCERVTHLADLGKPADGNFLDFKLLIVSHRILLDKMSSPQLDKHIMGWVRNWLTGRAQRVTSGWHWSLVGFCTVLSSALCSSTSSLISWMQDWKEY